VDSFVVNQTSVPRINISRQGGTSRGNNRHTLSRQVVIRKALNANRHIQKNNKKTASFISS